MIKIHLEAWPGEVRAAAVDDADPLFAGLLDYALWRPGAADRLGDIVGGRIVARVASMAGAFVALDGGTDGFLPDSEGAAGRGEGDAVVVRITRSATAGKGPRLTSRVDGNWTGLGLLRAGPNPVERLAALHPEAPIVCGTAWVIASLTELRARIVTGPQKFADDLAEAVDGLASQEVPVPGGGVLRIIPTPALVAIDMDSGAATGVAGARAEIWNRDMLRPLARQIRLRDLSGAIVVDLAGLSVRKRQVLGPAVAEALAADPRGPRFLGFTALGLAEILRSRAGPPLHELLDSPHAQGLAALRAVARSGARLIRAAPAVAAALGRDVAAVRQAADATGGPLEIRVDADLPPGGWRA